MKKLAAVSALLLLAVPGPAAALTTEDLVALVAMPVAVAAVADMSGVPTHQLIEVVSAMNRAAVPPPQFIEVVRYVPVALVDDREPRFTTYVTNEVDRGVRGQQLAVSMANRLDTYGIREINVVNPPIRIVEHNYIPTMVVTRVEHRRIDPLALVAMPLAVAAVAEMTGIPRNDLFNLITSLNRAAIPAPQFIEIVRYSPVVLVDGRLQPEFITFVDTSVSRGLIGLPLAIAIDERFRTYGIQEIRVMQPIEPARVLRRDFIPTTVVRRVAEVSGHPHGGPPGLLKRDLGVQTGAEVVHGTHPGQSAARTAAKRSGPAKATQPRQRAVREAGSEPRKAAPAAKQRNVKQDNRARGKDAGKPQKITPGSQPQASRSAASDNPGRGKGQAKGSGGQKGASGKGKGNGKGGTS